MQITDEAVRLALAATMQDGVMFSSDPTVIARAQITAAAPEIVRAWIDGLTDEQLDECEEKATAGANRVVNCMGFDIGEYYDAFRAALKELVR